MKPVVRILAILAIACAIGFGAYSIVQLTSAVPAPAAMTAARQQSPYGGPYGASPDGSASNLATTHGRPGGGSGNKLVAVLLVLAKFSGVFAAVAIVGVIIRRFLGHDKKNGPGIPEPVSRTDQRV